MIQSGILIQRLNSIRNQYGKKYAAQKLNLLKELWHKKLSGKKDIALINTTLLFLLAYPDNKQIFDLTNRLLVKLQTDIQTNQIIKDRLYNSGITNTQLCASFGFEIVKWFRKLNPNDIQLNSFDADEGQIQSILSAVLPKVESEILQDGNASWKLWLKQYLEQHEDLLDQLIRVFDKADIRPEVRDELWAALGLNVEINFSKHTCLPFSLVKPYYHRSLIKNNNPGKDLDIQLNKIKLTHDESGKIIECARTVLLRNLREIDPITFTENNLVFYYQLPRGFSIALMEMIPERRHPIDSYLGYTVFKNGLPVAYAGSWILFDSGRIGINVFSDYRGGESQYIFKLVLKVHQQVYRLKRFTVDPYQLGKDNKDGIHSGSFWLYYREGFRPMGKVQRILAKEEAIKIKSSKGYRSPAKVLKKLSESRQELILQKNSVRFDATDLSRIYAEMIKMQQKNKVLKKEISKLASLLQIKNYHEEKMQFILKNWTLLLLYRNEILETNKILGKRIKKLFELKAYGSEYEYIRELQNNRELRAILENYFREYLT